MEICVGTPVYGRKGKQVGEVSHIVLDGQTQQVTHMVVRKGWLLPRDIVVSLDDVRSTTPEQVTLDLDESELEEQPNFIESHYVTAADDEWVAASYMPSSVLYRPVVPPLGLSWYAPAYTGPAPVVETERNVPEGSMALAEGMDVWAGDEKVGTIAGVRMHPRTERVTHIVISAGWLFPEEHLLPVSAITTADEGGVQLAISPADLRASLHPERV